MRWKRPLSLLVLVGVMVLNESLLDGTNVAADTQTSPVRSGCIEGSTPLKFDKLSTAADRIIPAGAVLECIASGYTWTEGPVWINGRLFFADIPANSIHEWIPEKGIKTFLHPSGYKGSAPYTGTEPGSNGMTLDSSGRLTIAGHAQRNVYRLESLNPESPVTIMADSYQGKRLNSPNDLVYRSDGSLYFTDPPYGLQTQKDNDPDKQLSINGVYRIPHAQRQKPGAAPGRADLQLLISDLTRPNGLAFSPDEKYLYVANSEPQKFWIRYQVRPDGSLTDGKILYDVTSDPRLGNPDGVKIDEQGNIYGAGPGGVWIFSPEGKPVATILIPEKTANLTWAGSDRKTLYITASTSVYRVKLEVAGIPMMHSH